VPDNTKARRVGERPTQTNRAWENARYYYPGLLPLPNRQP